MDDLSSTNTNNDNVEVPIVRERIPSNSANNNNDVKKKRLRREIESLHQEMEVTGYAKGKTGHRQRKIPRDISKVRTQKRKLLEAVDDRESAILGEGDEIENDSNNNGDDVGKKRKRLRGSKAAIRDDVIRGSLVFQTTTALRRNKGDLCDNVPNDNVNINKNESKNVDDAGESQNQELTEMDEEGGEIEIGADGEEEDEEYSDNEIHETVSNKTRSNNDAEKRMAGKSLKPPPGIPQKQRNVTKPNSRSSRPSGRKRRKMYRLRNFQSFKMAQKHGDALAAHARGQPRLAIEKLKAVALAAPSAPQVYSSLGMVYEDMLKESRKRQRHGEEKRRSGPGDILAIQNEEETKDTLEASSNNEDPRRLKKDSIPDIALAEQCILATKAYGSHHVAAILCKKDFTLWVRAGDSAIDIADVHHDVTNLPKLSRELCEYHALERRRWQNEALRDYGVADNQKPPGIDVPAKLALMHMELGNLSNALTILTDLKNNADGDFQCSYKAWMLYSDLMLRLGHECIQWNNGIQKNENYMLRRWLRKHSKVFDWQIRRLQALSLAFEAAAGTANTKDFLAWIRCRIVEKSKCERKNSVQNGSQLLLNQDLLEVNGSKQATLEKRGGSMNVDNTGSDGTALKPTDSENDVMFRIESQLEREKEIMVSNQVRELGAFDKTTSEMNVLPESEAAKGREIVRNQLLKSHDDVVCTLEKEYSMKETGFSSNNVEQEEEQIIGMNADPLPLSGSIRQVCSIASELMKHLHGLELYDGARFVGDAVCSYMKDRARRHDIGTETKKKADEWQQKVLDSPFFLDAYDDGNSTENEDDSPYLSDEEILPNNDEESPLVESLHKGALTPELRVLYGLALIGEGGRNFIAAKYLEAIDDLEQEHKEWISEGDNETKNSSEPYWFLFRRAMTEQLTRTGAYAFLADVLRKSNKEHEWALHFSPYFRRHLETLKHVGLIDELLQSREKHEITPNINFRKNQLLKVILASCKFDIESIDESKERKRALHKSPRLGRTTQMEITQTVLSCVESIVPSVWSIESNGSLPPVCIEIVKIVAKCIRWFSTPVLKELSYSVLKRLVGQCTTIISFLCGSSIPESDDIDETNMTSLHESKSFPLTSSWQPTEFRVLSICAYNFAVACNVSLFSGWESEEFTLKLLKRRYGRDKHFGVHIRGRRLAGCLPSIVEDELKRQWELMADMQPKIPKIDFSKKLSQVQQSEWCQAEIKSREGASGQSPIAKYAEKDALEFFLGYAAMSIHLSRSETSKRVSNTSQQLALSVLLPLSQFCLDETLWDSDIGEAAASIAGYDQWQLIHGDPKYEPIGENAREGSYPKRIRKRSIKVLDETVRNWIEGPRSPTFVDFIQIPNSEFKSLWMQIDCLQEKETKTQISRAKEQMQKVHKAIADLRLCYTYTAAEKACLNLSIALLQMAAVPTCYDPFNSLQQAASFASQATKSGNSDTVYRQRLPETTQCTPREALIILGRADCLQAVYFPNEAAFLCSFVARVCGLHRNPREADYEWNDRWKIVAIYGYNVCVMIFTTVKSILNQTMQEVFRAAWERDVVEELERGRQDGRTWIRALTESTEAIELDAEYHEIKEPTENGLLQNGRKAPDAKLPLQVNQIQVYEPDLDLNIELEPEEFNQRVLKLLETDIRGADEDEEDTDEIVQYSV